MAALSPWPSQPKDGPLSLRHRLIATQNVADFQYLAIDIVNPWDPRSNNPLARLVRTSSNLYSVSVATDAVPSKGLVIECLGLSFVFYRQIIYMNKSLGQISGLGWEEA